MKKAGKELFSSIEQVSSEGLFAMSNCMILEGNGDIHSCASVFGETGYCGSSIYKLQTPGEGLKDQALIDISTWYSGIIQKTTPSIVTIDTSLSRNESQFLYDIRAIFAGLSVSSFAVYSSGGALYSITNMIQSIGKKAKQEIDSVPLSQSAKNCLKWAALLSTSAYTILKKSEEILQ